MYDYRSRKSKSIFYRFIAFFRVIEELFDKHNYKNITFFRVVVTALVVFFIVSGLSGIYLSYKIFDFVTSNVTRMMSGDRGGELVTIWGPEKDEASVRIAIKQDRVEEKRIRKFKENIEYAKKVAALMKNASNLSKEDIMRIMHSTENFTEDDKEMENPLKYQSPYNQAIKCNNRIIQWREPYKDDLLAKKRVLEQYKASFKKGGRFDEQSTANKTIDYVKRLSRYSDDYFSIDNKNMMRVLRTFDPIDLKVDAFGRSLGVHHTYISDVEELKNCLEILDITMPYLVTYSYDFDYEHLRNKIPNHVLYSVISKIVKDLDIWSAADSLEVPETLNDELFKIENIAGVIDGITTPKEKMIKDGGWIIDDWQIEKINKMSIPRYTLRSLLDHFSKRPKLNEDEVHYINAVRARFTPKITYDQEFRVIKEEMHAHPEHKEILSMLAISVIIDETNRELDLISSDNRGFTLRKYKQRQEEVKEWKQLMQEQGFLTDPVILEESASSEEAV